MKNIYGPITVDETEFQELFTLYWNAWENSKERLYVINEVNKYFYYYIVSRYPSDFDLASDFFLENINNTRKLIEEYDPSYHITFLAYLKTKLKRRFINFKLKFQKIKKLENLNEYYQVNPNLNNRSVFEPCTDYESDFKKKLDYHISKCFCNLNQDEEIAVKLYFCFKLGYKEFRYLKNKLGNRLFFQNYRIYLSHVSRSLSRERKHRGIIVNKLYRTNILHQEGYISNIEKRKNRLIQSFYEIKKPVPIRLIAEILQTNITNVHRRIKKGSLKIQRYFGESQLPIPAVQKLEPVEKIKKIA